MGSAGAPEITRLMEESDALVDALLQRLKDRRDTKRTPKPAYPRGLGEALTEAASHRGKFYLVEIMIPRGTLSKTMSRFA